MRSMINCRNYQEIIHSTVTLKIPERCISALRYASTPFDTLRQAQGAAQEPLRGPLRNRSGTSSVIEPVEMTSSGAAQEPHRSLSLSK